MGESALRRTMRFALFILMMSLLGTVWASPLAVGFGINLHGITVEEEFGIEVSEVACEGFKTVGDIVNYVEKEKKG